MDILHDIEASSKLIDSALEAYLSETHAGLEIIAEAQRYSVMSGGKRIRPYLTLAFSRIFGGRDDAAIPFACAVEMIHSYSLIHDDLPCMDNDDIRRGKPSCHVAFGEANALLTGDALLTRAFALCAENTLVDPDIRCNAASLLSRSAGAFGMIGGQVLDLYGETHEIDFETLLRLHKLKTGALIKAAVGLGCMSAGVNSADPRFGDAMTYAENIGLTFQIIDDLLDDEEGSEKEEKTTFLTFMDKNAAFEYASELTNKAVKAISKYSGGELLSSLADYLLHRKK